MNWKGEVNIDSQNEIYHYLLYLLACPSEGELYHSYLSLLLQMSLLPH
jgi:hypothetical protein